ncbi:MAG: ATP-binding protein, partial [Saprospiraceae bacterium]
LVNSTGMTHIFTFIENHTILSVETKSNLFRVVQEFIQNSLKHAQAKRIEIHLTEHNRHVCLTIKDDGLGFDIHASQEKGMGLANMKRRVDSLNGTFELNAKPGKGTIFITRIPIPLQI